MIPDPSFSCGRRRPFQTLILVCLAALPCVASPAQSPTETPEWRRHVSSAVDYQNHGDLPRAEQELEDALAAARRIAETGPAVAHVLDEMGAYYATTGKFVEAERHLTRSYAIWRDLLGPEDVALSRVINRLAFVYLETRQLSKAKQLDLETWARRVEQSDPSSPDLVRLLENLAGLMVLEGKPAEAEKTYLRALGLRSREEHVETVEQAIIQNDLGLAYFYTRRYPEAIGCLVRSLSIWERLRGPNDPNTALTLYVLALAYQADGRGSVAEPLLKRALAIAETCFGPRSLRTAEILSGYADFLRAHHRKRDARKLEARAKSIAGTASLPGVIDITELSVRSRSR